MSNYPEDVANQALDAIGSEVVIGDLSEGSREAQVLLRAYRNCLQQLLRAANWTFARKQVPLVLLGDVTGQTPDVGRLVQRPWRFCYEYPIDCMRLRFIPHQSHDLRTPAPLGNIAIPPGPLTTAPDSHSFNMRLHPSRFLVGVDVNYPPPEGQITWETQGVSPQGRTVIMSNVRHALAVYTYLALYPSTWDSLFRAALVAYLASEVALPLSKDKKFGLELRNQHMAIVKSKITEARVADGNEGVTDSTLPVDWMQARRAGGDGGGFGLGGFRGGFDDGLGITHEGFSSFGVGAGSAF